MCVCVCVCVCVLQCVWVDWPATVGVPVPQRRPDSGDQWLAHRQRGRVQHVPQQVSQERGTLTPSVSVIVHSPFACTDESCDEFMGDKMISLVRWKWPSCVSVDVGLCTRQLVSAATDCKLTVRDEASFLWLAVSCHVSTLQTTGSVFLGLWPVLTNLSLFCFSLFKVLVEPKVNMKDI